jgi:hypothetical protein
MDTNGISCLPVKNIRQKSSAVTISAIILDFYTNLPGPIAQGERPAFGKGAGLCPIRVCADVLCALCDPA